MESESNIDGDGNIANCGDIIGDCFVGNKIIFVIRIDNDLNLNGKLESIEKVIEGIKKSIDEGDLEHDRILEIIEKYHHH